MNIVASIQAAIKLREWSEGQFCRAAGIDQSKWSRIKHGTSGINVAFLQAAAKALPELKWQIAEYVIEGGNPNDTTETEPEGDKAATAAH